MKLNKLITRLEKAIHKSQLQYLKGQTPCDAYLFLIEELSSLGIGSVLIRPLNQSSLKWFDLSQQSFN